MANKAKAITIDHDDVVVSDKGGQAIAPMTKPDSQSSHSVKLTELQAIAPMTKPAEQPELASELNVETLRKAIKAQFSGSRAVIDYIASLNLTVEDREAIEKVRVIFYDTWPELAYAKQGMSASEARKLREELFSTKKSAMSENQLKIYNATSSAWQWVKKQCDLKAPPKKREPNSGTGKAEGEKEVKTINPADVKSFDDLANVVQEVAKILALCATTASQAGVKSCGLVTCMSDAAKMLRTQLVASRKENEEANK
jgi:hypothetical protein